MQGGVATAVLSYSTDGINWNTLYNSTSIFEFFCFGVAWNGTIWAAVGRGGNNTLAYSYDGITWTGLGKTIFDGNAGGLGITWNGTRFIAVGEGTNSIAYSYDGITWTGLGKSIFSTRGVNVAWNAGIPSVNIPTLIINKQNQTNRMLATGNGTYLIAYSDNNGVTWTGVNVTSIFTYVYTVSWNGAIWVALGFGTNSIAYSYDGITWTGLGTSIFRAGICLAWNGIMWVAGGNVAGGGSNSLAYSYDGITWTGLGKSLFSGELASIAWNGKRWVAVGNGTNSIAYSTNGINWIGLGSTITTGSTIVWSGTIFIAVGSANVLLYSYDGITWTTRTMTALFVISGMAWNGMMWVAVGNNYSGTQDRIAYSYDGITWTGVTGTSIFSTQGQDITWTGTRWVAVGYGTNTTAYSTDGITWTGNGLSPFSSDGYGIASGIGLGYTTPAITLNEYGSGISPLIGSNMEIVAPPYYNQGYTSFSVTFTPS